MEKKEARKPGSWEMDEVGRVLGVVELVDEDEDEKFEEVLLVEVLLG